MALGRQVESNSVANRIIGAAVGGGLVIGFAATLYAAAVGPLPPTSIEPDGGTRAVRVSHRHRMVVDCRHVAAPSSCAERLRDGDTATTVSFVRTDVEPSTSHPPAALRLTFAHQQGPQEQVATLKVGRWLVDWPGSTAPERLDIRADSHLDVSLTTISGACVQRGDRCELVSGVRERRIRVSETE